MKQTRMRVMRINFPSVWLNASPSVTTYVFISELVRDCLKNLKTSHYDCHELFLKAGLYRIWCGGNRLGDSGVHTLSDTSAFVNPAGQLLLTRRVSFC